MIGHQPHAAFGNSTGDRQIPWYTGAGDGARLMMLVLHDDAKREYGLWSGRRNLPDTGVGTFTQSLLRRSPKHRLGGHLHEKGLAKNLCLGVRALAGGAL